MGDEKNTMGTGPFKPAEYVAGSYFSGKRFEDYFVKGLPYLDGYRALFIKSISARVAAIRGGRAHVDFRYIGPSHRDDLVRAMGDKVTIQENTLQATLSVVFNTEKKPFDDPRVRRAMALAIDRWGSAKPLSKISSMKWVGGLLRPGSKYAMSKEELTQIAGFSEDIKASRKDARRLLKEAGINEGFSIKLHNRPHDNYQIVGVWLIDQWREIGLKVEQQVEESGPYFANLRGGKYDVSVSAISDYMEEPSLQFLKCVSHDKSPGSYGRFIDRTLDDLYVKQMQTMDQKLRKKLCDQFQRRVLDEMAYYLPAIWSHRIIAHSSKMKGWVCLPSHFLETDLTYVWLSED